ncbi:MAG: hypothetical protein GY757_02350, partial [bacterium]|nr:hypothetical protein [bacterium]
MKLFAQRLTEIFAHDLPFNVKENFPIGVKLDTVCRLACRLLKASSSSILLYSGIDDKLACKGRYIDPVHIDFPGLEKNEGLSRILKYICVINYLYVSKKNRHRKEWHTLFKEYHNSIYKGRNIREEDFFCFYKSYQLLKKEYLKYIRTIKGESYPIDDTSLSGSFYKKNLAFEPEYRRDIAIEDLDDIRRVNKEKKNLCLGRLQKDLQLSFNGRFYIAIPLFANNHYFGILRFIFAGMDRFYRDAGNRLRIREESLKVFEF